MVDLERREVVDVLPDRTAKATGEWLARHPGIEVVRRDRCGLYAEGARQGAPQARQVADRFHLLACTAVGDRGAWLHRSLSHLGRLVTQWRRNGHPVAVDTEATAGLPLVDPLTGYLVSPIVSAALCVKPRGLLTPFQAMNVDAFKASSPDFAGMRALAMRFRALLRDSDVEKLSGWLHDAQHSTLYGIRRFAQTLTLDLAAVRNAITKPGAMAR